MDPIKRNMTIKKVAGFHSFDFFALVPLRLSLRKGLGIKDVQNPVSTIVAGPVLDRRTGKFRCAGILDIRAGRPRPNARVESRCIDMLEDSLPGCRPSKGVSCKPSVKSGVFLACGFFQNVLVPWRH